MSNTSIRFNINFFRIFFGFIIFSASYAILNHKLLVAKILYRWAAYDHTGAVINFLTFSLQAAIFILVVTLLPKTLFNIVLLIASISGLVNAIHAQILNENIDLSHMTWMLSEYRQLVSAFIEFWPSFLLAFIKTIIAAALLILARHLIRSGISKELFVKFETKPVSIALLIAFLTTGPFIQRINSSHAAETNIYTLIVKSQFQTHQNRSPVLTSPIHDSNIKKIVWLIDESISYKYFKQAISKNKLNDLGASDYGEATSFGNCSAQSNAALRWGVNVTSINPHSDLTQTPSIWGYALKSGYKTVLIDGQVSGAPQNMIWPPERLLIEEFLPAKSDNLTDKKIAKSINEILLKDGKHFVYAVLKGAHYQYYSNYPEEELTRNSPIEAQYVKAIEYSKRDVFETLLKDVDREQVAIIYTSDHGQILMDGLVPHCNTNPYSDEFSIPLLAFLPKNYMSTLGSRESTNTAHSHSQIFPTTLILMGYSNEYAQNNYDNPLPLEPKRQITFGKNITPNIDGKIIDVRINKKYKE